MKDSTFEKLLYTPLPAVIYYVAYRIYSGQALKKGSYQIALTEQESIIAAGGVFLIATYALYLIWSKK